MGQTNIYTIHMEVYTPMSTLEWKHTLDNVKKKQKALWKYRHAGKWAHFSKNQKKIHPTTPRTITAKVKKLQFSITVISCSSSSFVLPNIHYHHFFQYSSNPLYSKITCKNHQQASSKQQVENNSRRKWTTSTEELGKKNKTEARNNTKERHYSVLYKEINVRTTTLDSYDTIHYLQYCKIAFNAVTWKFSIFKITFSQFRVFALQFQLTDYAFSQND